MQLPKIKLPQLLCAKQPSSPYYYSYSAKVDISLIDLSDDEMRRFYPMEKRHCTIAYVADGLEGEHTANQESNRIHHGNQQAIVDRIEIWERKSHCFLVAVLRDDHLLETHKQVLSTLGLKEQPAYFVPHITLQKEVLKSDCIDPSRLNGLIGTTVNLVNFRRFDVKPALLGESKQSASHTSDNHTGMNV